MLGRQIFRCDIRNLLFNIDGDQDPVCQLLVESVEETKKRFYAKRNVSKFMPATVEEEEEIQMQPEGLVCPEDYREWESKCVCTPPECVCSEICTCDQQPEPELQPPECVCSEPCVCPSPTPEASLSIPEVASTEECICDEECLCLTPPASICKPCLCSQEDVCTCVPPPVEVVVQEDSDTCVYSTDPCSCATPPPTSVESLLSCSESCICGEDVLDDAEGVCCCAEECICGDEERKLGCVCEEECSCEVCGDAPIFYRYTYLNNINGREE